MSLFKAGFGISAIAAAGIAFMFSDGETLPRHEGLPAAEDRIPAKQAAERFRLVLSGMDTGCEVVKEDSLPAQNARVIFGPGCANEVPDLVDVRFWSEHDDGSIAFVQENGHVAVRFAAGDGHALESFGAGAPLISLIAEEN
jgi:hypothetical protein